MRISKHICGILVFSLLMLSLSLPANAECSGFGDWNYIFSNGGVIITSYNGKYDPVGEICFPSYIDDYPVTGIGERLLYNNNYVTSVFLPDTVTSIGYQAFALCNSLEEVFIPEGLQTIGNYAFKGCTSLESIKLPNGLKTIGYGAFEYCCNLSEINIPEGITTIDADTFSNCSLSEIQLPDKLLWIGSGAFSLCKLSNIKIPFGVKGVGRLAFWCRGNLVSVIIPNSVTVLDSMSFETDSDVIYYCYSGSYCETYCKNYNYSYALIGDMNQDKNIDLKDLVAIKKYLSTTQEQKLIPADLNCDDVCNSYDLSVLRKFLIESAF